MKKKLELWYQENGGLTHRFKRWWRRNWDFVVAIVISCIVFILVIWGIASIIIGYHEDQNQRQAFYEACQELDGTLTRVYLDEDRDAWIVCADLDILIEEFEGAE